MALLGSVLYDPSTAATVSTASLAAMTAFDTTNARVTFTAPANGEVLVKIRVAGKGATAVPQILLGVLDGATVRGRQTPIKASRTLSSGALRGYEAVFPVTGLTPSTSYSFDAAYGVETVLASTTLGWGGPNDTTIANAYGALAFEVWETTNAFDVIHYDPATAVSQNCASLLAMTAMDTTNLRIAFTTPASGPGSSKVLVRLRGVTHGAATYPQVMLGVLDGSTVKMRCAPFQDAAPPTAAATDIIAVESCAVVAVSPSTSYTWDAAYGVEVNVASTGLKYGGPNNATANDAFGGFTYEIWKAG